ncbi:MAG: lysoplasmalogenase [Hyphomonas sp.]
MSLYIALALGAVYGAAFCYRDRGLAGLLIKTGSTALLALYAFLEGGPLLLVAALAFSALGDAFLAGKPERWLLPGMGAFFVAHAAYVPLFWSLGADERTLAVLAAQIVLVFGGAAFIRWLMPWIERGMRLPVIAYGAVILMMGAAALALPEAYRIVSLGALMFIASDVILSLQLFRKPADEPASVPSSLAVWILYFGGQALIAWGFLNAA